MIINYGKGVLSSGADGRVKLDSFPTRLGQWTCVYKLSLDRDIIAMLGTDAYIDYLYRSPEKREAEVLISYYASMHEGKQFHSPKNCMLGSGWVTFENKQVLINWRGKPVAVNYMRLRRYSKEISVLYWVQGRGRLLASEYQERMYRVIDAFLKNRSDGTFVRITLTGTDADRMQDLTLLTQLGGLVAAEVEARVPH
ncbi:MAG TPA: EpsI family protein [Syntrophales bacterium]|nr:EpsI family protein [Syntrophales bacterium]